MSAKVKKKPKNADEATKQLTSKLNDMASQTVKNPHDRSHLQAIMATGPEWQVFIADGNKHILDNRVKVVNGLGSGHEILVVVYGHENVGAAAPFHMKPGQGMLVDNVSITNEDPNNTVLVLWEELSRKVTIWDKNWQSRFAGPMANLNTHLTATLACGSSDPIGEIRDDIEAMRRHLEIASPPPRPRMVKVDGYCPKDDIFREIWINPEAVRCVQWCGPKDCQFTLDGSHFVVVKGMTPNEFIALIQGRQKPLSNADFLKKRGE